VRHIILGDLLIDSLCSVLWSSQTNFCIAFLFVFPSSHWSTYYLPTYHLSIYLYIYLSIYLSIFLSIIYLINVYKYICIYPYLPIYLFTYPTVCVFGGLSINKSMDLTTYFSTYPSVCVPYIFLYFCSFPICQFVSGWKCCTFNSRSE